MDRRRAAFRQLVFANETLWKVGVHHPADIREQLLWNVDVRFAPAKQAFDLIPFWGDSELPLDP